MPHTIRPGPQHAKKFVFIGASYKFDHRVIRDFLLTKRFNGSTFTIVDIDERPLKLVTDLTRRMVKQAGQDIKIDGVTDNSTVAFLRLTMPFNLSGLPAVSFPCGFSSDGLPLGLQVAGQPFAEATVLRIAHAYQQLTDWHRKEIS